MKRRGAGGQPSLADAAGRPRGQSPHCAPAAGAAPAPSALPGGGETSCARCSCAVVWQHPPRRHGSLAGSWGGQHRSGSIPSLQRRGSFFSAAPKGILSRRLSLTPALAAVPLGPSRMLLLLAGGMGERGVARRGSPCAGCPAAGAGAAELSGTAVPPRRIPRVGSAPGRAASPRSIPAPPRGRPAGGRLCPSKSRYF